MLDKMRSRPQGGEKELKVRIDPALHLQLHSLKIRNGQRIQDTVSRALQNYFEQLREEAEGTAAKKE